MIQLDAKLKRQAQTIFKAFCDFKVAGLAFLLWALIMPGGYESVFKPSWEKLGSMDQNITTQKQEIEKNQKVLQELVTWEKKLRTLQTNLITLNTGESPRVVAVSESKRVADLAGDVANSGLPAPHNQREVISLNPKGESVVNILTSEDLGMNISKEAKEKFLNLTKFDYELKVTGSYIALVDFINQLINAKNLVVIQSIALGSPGNDASNTPAPTPAGSPPVSKAEGFRASSSEEGEAVNIAVPLEMTLNFSIYLFDPNVQNQSAITPDPNAPQ